MNNKTSAIMASAITAILTVTVLTTAMHQAFAFSNTGTTLIGGDGGNGGKNNGNGNTNLNYETSHENVRQIAGADNGNGGNGGNALCVKSGCNTTVKEK
jgi:hypothetical protein